MRLTRILATASITMLLLVLVAGSLPVPSHAQSNGPTLFACACVDTSIRSERSRARDACDDGVSAMMPGAHAFLRPANRNDETGGGGMMGSLSGFQSCEASFVDGWTCNEMMAGTGTPHLCMIAGN